jgi:hypothetical protein
MTGQEFVRFCEQYYGERYDGLVRDVMLAYLNEKSEQFLDAAATVLIKRFSRANRIAPGPAELEKYRGEILDGIPAPLPLPDHTSDEDRERMGELLRDWRGKLERREDGSAGGSAG